MAVPEAVLNRRMQIRRLIRVSMVMAVMCSPPQGTTLHAHRADDRENELHGP
ncbi:MAG: hypothetical protein BWZ07_03380 [Alphaproteobacteria bacterium ADurb.BinA280]|nr:MAG: hypothetical protein BWZ07_03380 [Alphaproteobacteria bacterium ADurb.BinA280]